MVACVRIGLSRFDRYKSSLAIRCRKYAIGVKARCVHRYTSAHWPLERGKVIIGARGDTRVSADVQHTATVIFKPCECRIFGENFIRSLIGKGLAEAHATGDFRNDPPVRHHLADSRKKLSLARDAPLRIGDRAVLLAPACRRKAHIGHGHCVGSRRYVRYDHKGASLERSLHRIGVGHGSDRICRHDPERLDLPFPHRLKQIDGFQPRFLCDGRRLPETLHTVAVRGIFEFHMRGEHIGKTAHLAPAHRIGLPRHRERAATRLPDAARRQMAIDDGIDLIRTARRLIDALAIDRHHFFRFGKKAEETLHFISGKACTFQQMRRGQMTRHFNGVGKTFGMLHDIIGVDIGIIGKVGEQPVEQCRVTVRLDGQMQISNLSRRRASRIDKNDLHFRSAGLGRSNALKQYRMAPGKIGSRQHDEVGLFEVLIIAGHNVRSERTTVACNARSHAQARIRVDIG